MNMPKQLIKDLQDRISDIKSTQYSAEKQRVDRSDKANGFGGCFYGLANDVKYYDIDKYCDFLQTVVTLLDEDKIIKITLDVLAQRTK